MRLFRPARFRVLMVCRENICRSPMAEGLLRHHLRRVGLGSRVRVSSAGTHASQPGAPADQRGYRLAKRAGVKLGRIRAEKLTPEHLLESDCVFVMDRSNMNDLMAVCPPDCRHKASLLLSRLPEEELDSVPDPYYGSAEGFEEVYWLIERVVSRIADELSLERAP